MLTVCMNLKVSVHPATAQEAQPLQEPSHQTVGTTLHHRALRRRRAVPSQGVYGCVWGGGAGYVGVLGWLW